MNTTSQPEADIFEISVANQKAPLLVVPYSKADQLKPFEEIELQAARPTEINGKVCKIASKVGKTLPSAASMHERLFETGRIDLPEAPRLRLAHAVLTNLHTASNAARRTLLACCSGTADQLILAGSDKTTVSALYFRGRSEHREHIGAVASEIATAGSDTSPLTVQLGRHPKVVELWVFAPKGSDIELLEALSGLADTLLDNLLTGNRPVAKWRTHFLMPVFIDPKISSPWQLAEPVEQDEKDYFLFSANRLIGEGAEPNLKSWTMLFEGNHCLDIVNRDYGDQPLSAKIESIRLHSFGGSEYRALLEWVVGDPGCVPIEPVLWQRYLGDVRRQNIWPFARLIDYYAQARFFKHHYRHSSCPRVKNIELGDSGSKTMLGLLEAVVQLPGIKAVEDCGDRAFAFASVILDGGPSQANRLDSTLSFIATVDDYAPTSFYDSSFAQSEFAATQYRRFWGLGTYYLATDHSFAMVGHRQNAVAIADGRVGYCEDLIHTKHMRTMYHRIFLLCLFQQVGLDDIGRQITKRTDWESEEGLKKLRELRSDWISMRAARWFTSVSTELQGEELYRHMRAAMDIDEEVTMVDQKLADLEQVFNAADREKLEKREKRWKVLETVGLPVAIFLLLREAMYTGGDEYPEALTHIFLAGTKAIGIQNPFWALTLLSSLIAIPIWLYLSGRCQKLWNVLSTLIENEKSRWLLAIMMLSLLASFAWLWPKFKEKGGTSLCCVSTPATEKKSSAIKIDKVKLKEK